MASRKPSLKHPSHSHPLHSHKAQVEEEIICSGCNLALIGAAFECTKPECDFVLHKSCFALKPEICHKAHPNHPLTLLYSTYYKASAYQCNACGEYGSGFVYNCSICKYDLHVGCEAMPKSVKREDHAHPLKLLYHSPYKNCRIFNCGVCEETVRDRYWCYYCKECDYGTHLLDCTVKEEDKEEEEEPKRGRLSNGGNKGGSGSSGSGASELATMFEAQSEMENMKIDIHMEMQRAKTTRKARNVGLK